MDINEAIKARHSVRSYTDQKIEGETLTALNKMIATCNKESGLNIQLCLNEPTAFSGRMAYYGKLNNIRNYIALVGKKSASLEEQCGYYGEKIVLEAQQLALNTCWVAMSFSKAKSKSVIKMNAGEKLLMVISIGYGENAGVSHKIKSTAELSKVTGTIPNWFKSGMVAASLAPTARNQQKFLFTLKDNKVSAVAGTGFYTKTDLGIVKYHFEVGAGDSDWEWQNN